MPRLLPVADVDDWGIEAAKRHKDEAFALRCECGAAPKVPDDKTTQPGPLAYLDEGGLHYLPFPIWLAARLRKPT